MPDTHFSYTDDKLRQIAKDVLDYAAKRGASAAETEVSEGFGQTVTVRRGEVETIEYNRDKGIGVTVYIGQQRGHASTTDFSPQAMRDTVDAALSIARFTASDDCAGLADADMLAREIPGSRPVASVGPARGARDRARARPAKDAGFAVDRRLTNSEGATRLHAGIAFRLRQLARAFSRAIPSSRHGIWCALIAGKNDEMQRDDWYETTPRSRRPAAAGERGAQRRRARGAAPRRAQDRDHAGAGAVRGADRGEPARAFRVGGERRQPLPQVLVPARQPGQAGVLAARADRASCRTCRRASPAAPFDEEGVATRAREVVKDGVRAGLFSRQLLGAQARA